jgi:hypothetical protein
MSKIFLVDIDGTICDDIKNEDSHLYPTANEYPNAKDTLNKWYDEGNQIHFFTARENKDWKRFYKKCDALTRAIKAEILKEWDGYDYYDSEYIKPYLELSVHHKNYPTLDHKYPRSRAFQDGLTPYEITTKENLVWTKRTNNSRKGNKTLNV